MVIFTGIFIYGIGGCFYYVFGLPYGDDNSSKEDGPMQFGIIWVSRLLGPAMGFFLGGFWPVLGLAFSAHRCFGRVKPVQSGSCVCLRTTAYRPIRKT